MLNLIFWLSDLLISNSPIDERFMSYCPTPARLDLFYRPTFGDLENLLTLTFYINEGLYLPAPGNSLLRIRDLERGKEY